MRETKRVIHSDNLVALLGLGYSLKEAHQLQAIAKRLYHLYECECDYDLTPYQEARERTMEEQIADVNSKYPNMLIVTQGDPRGWPLEIYNPDNTPDKGASPILRVCPF